MDAFPNAPDDITDERDERDDVSSAPESGQPPGGPEDPWEGEKAGEVTFPPPHHAVPNEEL
jgi:hypothetical protein